MTSTTHPIVSFERGQRTDSRGITVRVRGDRVLAFNHWRLWRYQKRDRIGFLFQVRLPIKIPRGCHAWRHLPAWKRWLTPPNWMRRTFFVGWRTRGGKGPTHGPWPKLRIGFAHINDVPYSFQ